MESIYEFSEDYNLLFDLVTSGKEVFATIVDRHGIRRSCLAKQEKYSPKDIVFGVQGIEYAMSENDRVVFAKKCKICGVKFFPTNISKNLAMPKPNVFVGADPSFRKGGFWVCVLDRDIGKAEFVEMKDLEEFRDFFIEHQPRHVIVENSNLQNQTFDLTGGLLVVAKKSRDVGKNMAISQCAADIARKFTVFKPDISPKQKGAKIENEKVFQGIVRSQGLTLVNYKGLKREQDKRDALMLALIAEQQWKLQTKIKKP